MHLMNTSAAQHMQDRAGASISPSRQASWSRPAVSHASDRYKRCPLLSNVCAKGAGPWLHELLQLQVTLRQASVLDSPPLLVRWQEVVFTYST